MTNALDLRSPLLCVDSTYSAPLYPLVFSVYVTNDSALFVGAQHAAPHLSTIDPLSRLRFWSTMEKV
jgi:hypothetical protein